MDLTIKEKYQRHKEAEGETFFIGDIHGYYTKAMEALKEAGFRVGRGDKVICVGDLIDRGPENEKCLSLIDQEWFLTTIGNHEQLMRDSILLEDELSIRTWVGNGGRWALDYIDNDYEFLLNKARKIDLLPYAIDLNLKNSRVLVTHAEPPEEIRAEHIEEKLNTKNESSEKLKEKLVWGRDNSKKALERSKNNQGNQIGNVEHQITNDNSLENIFDIGICGHTIMPQPIMTNKQFYIDIGAAKGNRAPYVISETELVEKLETHRRIRRENPIDRSFDQSSPIVGP